MRDSVKLVYRLPQDVVCLLVLKRVTSLGDPLQRNGVIHIVIEELLLKVLVTVSLELRIITRCNIRVLYYVVGAPQCATTTWIYISK